MFTFLAIFVAVMAVSLAATYVIERFVKPDQEEQGHIQAVFAFIGSGYGVLLGILVFLAMQNYNDAELAASTEASSLTSMSQIVQVYPEPYRTNIRRGMICYGRTVVDDEWPSVSAGKTVPLQTVDLWARYVWRELGLLPTTDSKRSETYQVALQEWTNRADARAARLVFADQSIPVVIWVVVYVGAAVVVMLTGLFPTKRHRARLSMFVGVIAVLGSVVVTLAVVQRPYLSLPPDAMQNSVRVMTSPPVDPALARPCPSRAPALPEIPGEPDANG